MVKLTEVEDEHFTEKPPTTKDNVLLADDDESDGDYTDTVESDLNPSAESFTERLSALVDIIPPKTRANISTATNKLSSYTKTAFSFSGKTLWVVSTSAMLLMIPFSLAVSQEQEIEQQEREQGMLREGASQMLQSGSAGAPTGTEAQGGQSGRPSL
ncbi:MAG: hypothetical protein Q9227_002757 [Pyrenula ochraceoflavens]